ncbi:extracellular mutant protein 11-domain-containing protein [Nemania sp. FL0916]|nr:extracellular mutant protein 11-domain-containing protein [Nemania sp. FL0916]
MPPAAASFFKQSRTKMQAWVTHNPGLGHSQPGVATSAPATAYDSLPSDQIQGEPQTEPQSQPQIQTQIKTQTEAQTRHVNIPQPRPTTSTAAISTQQAPPRPSRSPIVNANSERAATAMAARIPVPPRLSRPATQDESTGLARSRATSSEPLQQPKRPGPFWEGSTIEGSAFSDTASNIDANASFAYRQLPAQGHPAVTYQPPDRPRHRPASRLVDRIEQPHSLVIGPNGLIDMVGNGNGNGLTRSASTPDARSPRHGFREITSDSGPDPYADDSVYNTSPEKSPEKTPMGKRLQHSKTLALRSTRRESYSEQIGYAKNNATAVPQPSRPHVYIDSNHDEVPQAPQAQPERLTELQVAEHQAHRPTNFAGTDAPMANHQDESDNASVEQEPTPIPVPKPAMKVKSQVNRQLFARPNKGKAALRESAILRPSPEKRPPATKKRSLELDYDDGALASMDYTTLKGEAFDFDPAQAEARSVFEPPRGTLSEKLNHFFAKDEATQADFFIKMPVKDWEESGDWFLERFGEIIAGFKEARKEKREIVNAFENEVAERESAVRNKIHGIGQTLADLKAEGQNMMLGKELD